MPATQTQELRIVWKVRLPVTVAAQIEHRLMDPITRKPRYRLRSKLVTKLLQEWLVENPVPARDMTEAEVEDLEQRLIAELGEPEKEDVE